MKRFNLLLGIVAGVFTFTGCGDDGEGSRIPSSSLRVGVSAVRITPCGANPEWDGPITASGVWGESYTDSNVNGRWDAGEAFVDDPVNHQLDPASETKYDGIFMAGFGNDRIALGCHDDIWARAIVLESGETKIAMVSVDVVGEVLHGSYYGFAKARAMVNPALGVDTFIFSSTHSHEGPDTLGLWGESEFQDGKFPRYLQFIDRQVARAIEQAADPAALKSVTVAAAATRPEQSPELRGLQVRTGCRPPWFFDTELRALRFIDRAGATVATLINWNTHPESLESENTFVSSDFVHYIRERVERDLGGTAVYFTGDLGAAEIVGDTCVGGADPREPDGTNDLDRRDDIGFPRTQYIGETVGDVAVRILRDAPVLPVQTVEIASAEYQVAGSNAALSFANMIGLLDLDPVRFSLDLCPPGTGVCVPVEQHVLSFRDASQQPLVQMVTAPGELFPEIFYGAEANQRTDCPAANTGLPYEPSIVGALDAPYRFLIGLSPDELGYIVPAYDFFRPPGAFEEARDPCHGQSYDPAVPRRTVPRHYHETLSVGVDLSATTACYPYRLLGDDQSIATNAACQRVLP